ncbi:Phosphotyrosyl phosphatase activator [Sistotremastrum niveocremeum HHB9708]|uniref:Serine/threonine-protein phosphatase 2A activator n=1 Tax=Sistotremastrum niveocremeum HHB9708 TaxID=1314777 RepID=A0A164VJ95_9AGAM|nr:Phosphotyrosyl phosphatase activator [Sistotremastrum niveocremeum HHB9708]
MQLPPLPELSTESLGPLPTQLIRTDQDLLEWKKTKGYSNLTLFLSRLSESVVGYSLPLHNESEEQDSEAITATLKLLDQLESWIADIPPLDTPQRFGNRAFISWGDRLKERAPSLLQALLPQTHHATIPFLTPYFLTSFGSFIRLDYGTGHEASFACFLLGLTLVRFFDPKPAEERHLVLRVFERYLRLVWALQDVYRLEPAGSHGVWGLDDYSFLGYIFGSGQLRGHSLNKCPMAKVNYEADVQDSSPSSILKPPLPPTNLFYISITRILQCKQGPFHEHSSQLYSIATGVPRWSKVNSGLFKMYDSEVLGKRVVVQHLPLGGLLEWDRPTPRKQDSTSSITPKAEATRAPWAR